MVILPYKDSLLLFSRYLQQLVMESLGKEFDLDGNRVCGAINVLDPFSPPPNLGVTTWKDVSLSLHSCMYQELALWTQVF